MYPDRPGPAVHAALALLSAAMLMCHARTVDAATLNGEIVRPDKRQAAALITLHSAERGLAWTLQSAPNGRFRVENLPAGHYELTVRSRGLPVLVMPLADFDADSDLTIPLQMGPMNSALTSADMLAYLPTDHAAGDARQLLRFHCVQCHGLEFIAAAAKTPEQWDATVKVMAGRVPPAPAGEMDRISDYLARNFGAQKRGAVPMTGATQFAFEANAVLVELNLPKAGAHPHDIRLGPDENLWVADFDVRPDLEHNSLFRIDPQRLQIETIELAVAATGARSINFDRDGAAWVNILFGDLLARMDPESRKVTTFPLPDGKTWPHSLSFGPEGEIWFSGMWSDELGRFEPSSGAFSFRKVPTGRSMLYDVEVDQDGRVWYTGLFAHQLGRFDPKTNAFAEFKTPTPLSSTRYLDIGPTGDIWVALFAAGRIARFDLETESFEEISLPDPNGSPYDVQATAAGRVWYTDFTRNAVASFDINERQFREYAIPTSAYARPAELEIGADGRIWFCENGVGKVGFIDPDAIVTAGVYRVPDDIAR